jgi:glutamate synthase domain-containing protein 3
MSGGIAYVLDERDQFRSRCNQAMVELETPTADDLNDVKRLVLRHVQLTASPRGQSVLDRWQDLQGRIVKVMPIDYKRILLSARQERRESA